MKHNLALCLLLVLSASLPARGADSQAAAPSAYESVMRAQYAAHAEPQPARPEEAQRIYDAYLRSIGQPAKDNSTSAGDNTGTSPH